MPSMDCRAPLAMTASIARIYATLNIDCAQNPQGRSVRLAGSVAKNRFISLLGLVLLGLVATLLAWRVIVTNLSEMVLQDDGPDAAAQALRWDERNAQALYLDALGKAKANPALATNTLLSVVRNNPTDGPAYAALARLDEQSGHLTEAGQAMKVAAQLAPRRVDVQLEVARFWFRRGDLTRAMQHMDVALTFGDSLRDQLFPDLLKLAEVPASRNAAYAKLLKQPLLWWPQFFSYAASNAGSVETLRALFRMQSDGPNGMTSNGLRAYLQRLQRDNLWVESYLVWLNHLRKDQLNAMGNLFNGGFEGEISNLGFDWIVTPASQVSVDTASTYGATGNKALRVVFKGPRIQFQHLHQYVMLDPGAYTLHGRVRPENFEAVEGLQWTLTCVGAATPFASSERFTGTDHWRYFSVQFRVPGEACAVQMLRLELAGRSAVDFEARGAVWFDDLSIDREAIQ